MLLVSVNVYAQQAYVRPYELDWAGRFTEDRVPLVDFENIDGWTLEANGGTATLSLSQEQMIWGNYTGKISYYGKPEGADFTIRPPQPIPIAGPFTAVDLWVWNNYWDNWGRTPQARLSVLLENQEGATYEIPFPIYLDWPGWFLLHIRLSSVERKTFEKGGFFKGVRLYNCLLTDETKIYLDNLSVYQEINKPVHFEIEPRPGIDLPAGQNTGVHTGQERLPFPTREETMLPGILTDNFSTEIIREGNSFIFRYSGSDGLLEYRYTPEIGNLGDISAQWMKGAVPELFPLNGGGVKFAIDHQVEGLVHNNGCYIATESKTVDPDKIELIECKKEGEMVVSKWKILKGDESAEVEYVFRLWQKSLVIDIRSLGGKIGEVSLGNVKGAVAPRLLHVPYWSGENVGVNRERPAVLVMGEQDHPLFMTVFADHYRTGCSRFNFINKIEKDATTCAGGTYYLPKTNGERNDCYERIFLTFSPRFEEVLPTVDNPPSKWRDIVSDYLSFNYVVKDREKDHEHWKMASGYGLRQIVVMDHETGWRDGDESFTFRTKAAPAKGGDEGQKIYGQRLQELGMRYGIYNNYTDLSPVNAYWDEDMVIRTPDGSWMRNWYRCYAAKTQKTVSIEQEISSEIQRKFNLNAGCLDVHTAITPWRWVDYDERVPGAGTMFSQFYDFGQMMLHQQDVYNGPVFSEGNTHYYYAGLLTGSNGIDDTYLVYDEPWLVDFDLLKLHPLGCDLGFDHIYSKRTNTDSYYDRYFAGTIAFGHLGRYFDFTENMQKLSLRSYYMQQQLASSYCKALVKEIRYADNKGKLFDTSTAIATDIYRDSRIHVQYDNGLFIWVNGNTESNWEIPDVTLPPNGYYAKSQDGELVVFSALLNDNRADYVLSPAYDYMDGRGTWVETPVGASDGVLIVLKDSVNDVWKVIPFETTKFTITLKRTPESVTAFDMNHQKTGTVQFVHKDGHCSWTPVPEAISYVIKFMN